MRLICPNCGAQYEISDDVIPEEGRDVQCSNCGHTWFQTSASTIDDIALDDDPTPEHADLSPPKGQTHPEDAPAAEHDTRAEAEADKEPERDAEPEAAEETARGARPLSQDVQSILQQEAAFEEAARKSEAEALEYQQDLGLSGVADGSDRETQARERMARLRDLDPEDPETTPEPPAEPTRKELLPDIDQINSTLRGGIENASVPLSDIIEDPDEPQRRGFRTGFSIALLIAAVLALAYVFAPEISQTVPSLAGPMEAYVSQVDALRIAIDTQLKSITQSMNGNGG